MRTKIFEDRFNINDDTSCVAVGSHRTEEWIIGKITFVGWNNNELTIISECFHKDDCNF